MEASTLACKMTSYEMVLQVYLGVWKDQEVAVKLARQAPISLKNERQFQANIAMLHSLNHPNVVTFLGACCWKVQQTFYSSSNRDPKFVINAECFYVMDLFWRISCQYAAGLCLRGCKI